MRFLFIAVATWILCPLIGFIAAVKILTTVGLIAAVLGIWHPVIGVYGITILCTLDSVTRVYVMTGGLYRWNTVNYLLLIALAIGAKAFIHRNDLSIRLLQLFVVYLLLQLLPSPNRSHGALHCLGIMSYFGLTLYLYRGTKDSAIWHQICLLSNTLAALGGFFFFWYLDDLPNINKNSWVYLPLVALFSTCLCRAVAASRDKLGPLIALMVMINAGWVLLAGSRGGMTIAICCLLYLLSEIRGVSKKLTITLVALTIGVILSNQFVSRQEYLLHRFDKTMDSSLSLAKRTSGRSDLVIGGYRIFAKKPVLGVGTGGFGGAWRSLRNREGMGGYAATGTTDAHSAWIKTLAEGGLVGFALLTMFVASFTIVGLQSGRRRLRKLGLLVSLTLSVAFISTEFQGKGFWFFSAGAAIVMARDKKLLERLATSIRLQNDLAINRKLGMR